MTPAWQIIRERNLIVVFINGYQSPIVSARVRPRPPSSHIGDDESLRMSNDMLRSRSNPGLYVPGWPSERAVAGHFREVCREAVRNWELWGWWP